MSTRRSERKRPDEDNREAEDRIRATLRCFTHWQNASQQDIDELVKLCKDFPMLAGISAPVSKHCCPRWRLHNSLVQEKRERRFYELSPLTYLINSKASLRVIQDFVNLHQDVLQSPLYLKRNSPLHEACAVANELEPGVISFMAAKFPGEAEVSYGPPLRCRWTREQKRPRLPLYAFLLTYKGRGANLFDDRRVKDFTDLFQATFPDKFASLDSNARDAAQTLLDISLETASNTRVVHFIDKCVSCKDLGVYPYWSQELYSEGHLLQHYVGSLITMLTTQTLESIDLEFYNSYAPKGALTNIFGALKKCKHTKILKLKTDAKCRIVDEHAIVAIKESLKSMTSLEEISLQGEAWYSVDRSRDLTDSALLLVQQTRAKKITIDCKVQPAPLFEALQSNTILEHLEVSLCTGEGASYNKLGVLVDVLREYNKTLQSIKLWKDDGHDPLGHKAAVGYYARLNRLGRARAMDQKTTAACFLSLIENCNEQGSNATELTGNTYGFLRVNPVVWLQHVSPQQTISRKRTHHQMQHELW